MSWRGAQRLRQSVLGIAGILLFQAIAPGQTTATQELGPNGDPLKPNERRVSREELDQKYWGVKLDEIQDETFVRKEDETLHIDAGGHIFIKKHTADYHGETGAAYGSDEEMFMAEKRWEELQEYQKRIYGTVLPIWRRFEAAAAAGPRVVLRAPVRRISRGDGFSVTAAAVNVSELVPVAIGLCFEYDTDMLRLERIFAGPGITVKDSVARTDTIRKRGIVKLELLRSSTQSKRRHDVRLVFRAKLKGVTQIELLSVEPDARFGKTYLSVGEQVVAPSTKPLSIDIQ